jgi:hypothetical protein
MGWGGNMLLLGGAMARIPIEVLESARLDGVGSGRELVQMILPLLWPTVSTLFILKLTNMFGSSAGALLFCGFYADQVGANTISLYIYTALYGPGANTLQAANSVSAVGLIFTCIAVPTVMIMRWLVEKVPVVESVLSPESKLTMYAPDGGCFKPGVNYYFVLFPRTFSKGLTMTYYKEGACASYSYTKSCTLARNKVSRFADRDAGLTFENIPLNGWGEGENIGGEI